MENKKFELGRLVCTAGVNKLMATDKSFKAFVDISLGRYINCDWNGMDDEDIVSNNLAVLNGDDRIFASYTNKNHPVWRIYIITEYDRSATTILFPNEY